MHRMIEKYADIRSINEVKEFMQSEYLVNDIITYSFNENSILKNTENIQADILERGKNPGLGVRELHSKGITGKNVIAAIIVQNLCANDHPSFKGKIIEYFDTGCEMPSDSASMHTPAVTSLFIGDEIGIAPDTKIYFAAVPSWAGDTQIYIKELWNNKLTISWMVKFDSSTLQKVEF